MTLAYDYAGTVRGGVQNIPSAVVATANDTTAAPTSKVYTNLTGHVKRINFGVVATNGTGTSPTITYKLQGSLDGTNFFDVLDSGGSTITTGAVTAAATNSAFVDTNTKGIVAFPPYIRFLGTVGGSSTPGWTGTLSVMLDRSPHITKQ